jgi:hypothetical protein
MWVSNIIPNFIVGPLLGFCDWLSQANRDVQRFHVAANPGDAPAIAC